jgi:hypothetical protein
MSGKECRSDRIEQGVRRVIAAISVQLDGSLGCLEEQVFWHTFAEGYVGNGEETANDSRLVNIKDAQS